MNLRFSPSSLSVFRDCPRCFFIDQRLDVKRPRGIFPSLPNGMDRVLKTYVDQHRAEGTIPPEIQELGGAQPFHDAAILKKWRHWKSAPMVQIPVNETHQTATLSGAIDDLIVWRDGMVSPYDFKTKSSAPKDGDSEKYYGPQMDAYHLLIETGGSMRCNGRAYLDYWWPAEVLPNGVVRFDRQTVTLKTDPARAIQLVRDAAVCLAGIIPPPEPECEYCLFHDARTLSEKPALIP